MGIDAIVFESSQQVRDELYRARSKNVNLAAPKTRGSTIAKCIVLN